MVDGQQLVCAGVKYKVIDLRSEEKTCLHKKTYALPDGMKSWRAAREPACWHEMAVAQVSHAFRFLLADKQGFRINLRSKLGVAYSNAVAPLRKSHDIQSELYMGKRHRSCTFLLSSERHLPTYCTQLPQRLARCKTPYN